MSESKHTPGPWVSSPYIGAADSWFVSAGSRKICGASGVPLKGADADLIAAAPDLLAALRRALATMENVDGENDCRKGISAAEAAIAKAEGRS